MMGQLPLLPTHDSLAAAADYGLRSSGERHGVVLTKAHVVDLILDLCGYDAISDLGAMRLLDPACGQGAFVLAALDRLIAAAIAHGRAWSALDTAIAAYDIDAEHVATTRAACMARLVTAGADSATAAMLAQSWIRCEDFLRSDCPQVDFVVGNPPYVRIEQIPRALQDDYRNRFDTLYDRADLYIAFFERGLDLLRPGGMLGYICADRWTLNRYGTRLREFIARRFCVRAYLDLHATSPFDSEVIAYPAIVAIQARQQRGPVAVARLHHADPHECQAVAAAWRRCGQGAPLSWRSTWFQRGEPWVLTSEVQTDVLRALEARWPTLESAQTGARVGIGVASGADDVFIVSRDADIEADRLLPLVRREDIAAGRIRDASRCVINTFDDLGGIVPLDRYPRMARHLGAHPRVAARFVARKNPASWFRTIDRVVPALVATPKLLIPDIAGANEVTLDPGAYYPHHNLYYVVASAWDLEVLGALLSSKVALFFVWSYGTRMRGGYLRFQAQFLRRIRIPPLAAIDPSLRAALAKAFRLRDFAAIDAAALEAYRLPSLPAFEMADRRGR